MKKHHNYLITLLFLGFILLLAGCNFDCMFDKSLEIPNSQWSKKQPLVFDVPVMDTIHGFNLLLNVRNTNKFPYSNCYFFISTRSPKGIILRDTLQYIFANETGKWLGKGFGGVWSNYFHYKNNIRFPYKGNYKVEIYQAMRDEPLNGLMDVGFRIEQVK